MPRFKLIRVVFIGCGIFTALTSAAPAEPTFSKNEIEFFEARIRPVLVKHCYECHSSALKEPKGGLALDVRAGLLRGGDSGPAIVAGQPDDSLLLAALRHDGLEMPPKTKLPDRVATDFARWIRAGAADPRLTPPTARDVAEQTWQAKLQQRRQWWSLQPPRRSHPPNVGDRTWSGEAVDRFVRAALDQQGLTPAAPAEPLVLLRRLAFVLTGLPPSASQVRSFPASFARDADGAVEQLVDELLASPRFGERFARHWMDVVRYTDTYGYEWDNPAKGSWEYRDYLIRAFNADIGFDQLIREQLAGDLLTEPRIDHHDGVNESLIGPMFYHMGEHRHGNSLNFNGIHQEMINNKVDAFSKAFLAMTVGCARCHDHKLDAISQADYYALAGMFMSPRWTSRVVDHPGKHAAAIADLKRLRWEIRRQLGRRWKADAEQLGAAIRTWAADNAEPLKKTKLGDVAYPLAVVVAADDDDVGEAWSKMVAGWRATRAGRLASNSKQFEVLADFATPRLPDGWTSEGDGIAHGYVPSATPRVSLSGDSLIAELLPRGYHTHALSPKLPGAVRLPAQDKIPGRLVSLRLQGGEWSGYLVVPQNAFQSEAVTFLTTGAQASWRTIADLGLANGVTRVFAEISTSSLNPNFPPRTGLARAGKVKLPDHDDGFDKRSWFSLTGIVTHDGGGGPQDPLDLYQSLFSDKPPATREAALSRLADWLHSAVHRWADETSQPADESLLNWLVEHSLLTNSAKATPAVAALVSDYRRVEATLAFPRTVNGMDERGVAGLDYRLNIRGNVDEEGPAVGRGFLSVFAGAAARSQSDASGRRELADYLAGRDNPQTARVYVNRVWQWVFGRGLVATPSDFGRLGERPSHPQLLDWIAIRFMDEGWSTKRLVRRLVLSRTFRQAGRRSSMAVKRDPGNRLLHHYPTRRLEAEAIRDSLLAVSGRFDGRQFGRPVNPPRPSQDPAKRLFSGPLDSDGRRSIYMKMSIMEPPKFLVCFNLPDLKLPTGRRDTTNDPAQALAMLNHPLVVKLADHWSDRLVRDSCRTPGHRIARMFIAALGRPPQASELERWTAAVAAFAQDADEVMHDRRAWAELAHALFNTKEFIYYR